MNRCFSLKMRSLQEDDALVPSRAEWSHLFEKRSHDFHASVQAKLVKEIYYHEMRSNVNNNEDMPFPSSCSFKKGEQTKIYQLNSPEQRLRLEQSASKSFQMTDMHRRELCEWGFKVIDLLKEGRNTVAIALNYLDRFLKSQFCTIREDCKLAFITCLCLSTKMYSHKPLSMKSLSKISNGSITLQDIEEMESLILKALQWNLCPPIASNFCHDFQFVLPHDTHPIVRKAILERSCFFCELSLFQGNLFSSKPSEVAFAATLNATFILEEHVFPSELRKKFLHEIERNFNLSRDSETIQFLRTEMLSLNRRCNQGYNGCTTSKRRIDKE